jgi:hypothetical protein
MSNDAAIANLISDIGPTIERADPAVARAALAHLFAAAVVCGAQKVVCFSAVDLSQRVRT